MFSVVFDVSWFQYFHVLNDKIGQYEVLKTFYPDLKLLCIADYRSDFDISRRSDLYLNILDMISVYNMGINDIYFKEDGDINVEQVVYYSKTNNKYK